jgi:hypothetical protein
MFNSFHKLPNKHNAQNNSYQNDIEFNSILCMNSYLKIDDQVYESDD